MNKDRLNKLISIYIDKLDMINNDEHDENMKWKAVYHYAANNFSNKNTHENRRKNQ